MKKPLLPLAVALCLLILLAQPATVSAKDNWVSVRTKNFFMIGNADEKEIRKVALKLEQFRQVFTRLLPNVRFNTPVPTTVIVFKSDSSYAPFKAGPNTAGYFQSGEDVNYITLTTELQTMDPFNVIFHEYTHLLVNNTFENAPVWFNEGLAEYYSTFAITDDQKIEIGRAIGNHVLLLRQNKMLPLRTLFQVDHKSPHYNEGKKQSIFYAQSWALMHYLIVGKAGKAEKLGQFVNLLSNNVPMETAFQQAFETSFEAMEKELRDYVKQDRYNFIKGHFEKKLELDTSVEAVPLTEAETQAYLGDLLWHGHRADAVKYLEKALKLDPNLGMAHASLGMLRFYEGKVDEARASLERAVAGNSQNYLAHYYYAFTLSRQRPEETNTKYTPEEAAKIRLHLQRAIALRPDYPESYDLLAFVTLVSGTDKEVDDAIQLMKRVLQESPGRMDSAFMLAQLYLRKQDYKAARPLLEQIAKSDEDEIRQPAQQMLANLDSYEKQVAEIEAARKAAASAGNSRPGLVNASGAGSSGSTSSGLPPGTLVTDTPAAPSDPSSYLREVLRKPQPGETQVQATLVRVDCDAKGMTFVVRTSTGDLRLSAKSFDDMELTTYSPDVKGEIGCGPRKPENVVIVCYLPNTDKRVKADGILKSIEFVPADFKLAPSP
jgi:tetratricopeptide (TPR) repeat protein